MRGAVVDTCCSTTLTPSQLLRQQSISFMAAGGGNANLANAERERPAQELAEASWDNLDGLPKVIVSVPSAVYVSKDIATLPGQSRFKPSLGCKCGLIQPAPAHPEIDFRKSFLDAHPDFEERVRRLRVHMDDNTAQRVVWDAEYDLKRFLEPGVTPSLAETIPAIERSGTQPRFLTFCPPENGPPHKYELTVSAADAWGNPIEYLQGNSSSYVAMPPEPPFTSGAAVEPSAIGTIREVGQSSHGPTLQ